jgi:chitinase
VNFTALLKELRAAIDASGHEYIVTFTSPTSYWYLQNFDLKNMVAYVDWINLMAYDLLGVWDSNNPIGNQVLAHTNLTQIDQALDLVSDANRLLSSVALLTERLTSSGVLESTLPALSSDWASTEDLSL